jgi:hypothetical protein
MDLAKSTGDQAAPLAGAAAKDIKDVASKAIEAAKTGDLSAIKKLGEGITETLAENGDKVLKYAGAAAITKLLEPLAKDGLSFASIGTLLSNLWKLFTK